MISRSINSTDSLKRNSPSEGVLWLPIHQKDKVIEKAASLKSQEIRRIRVGINCKNFHDAEGKAWYDWLIPFLGKQFDLILTFEADFENPGKKSSCYYSFFEMIEHFTIGKTRYFDTIEVRRSAPYHTPKNLFSDPLVFSAIWAKSMGIKVILGNIQTKDFEWVNRLIKFRLIDNFDFMEINKEEEDLWSSNTDHYEKTLIHLLAKNGCTTSIRVSAKPIISLKIYESEFGRSKSIAAIG